MSVYTIATLTTDAQQIAQDAANASPALPLLHSSSDYADAITMALRMFEADRPNIRVYDYTVVTAGFRFVLAGTGAVLPTTGTDKWADGFSQLTEVWWPYLTTEQGAEALDENFWRVVPGPSGATVLEFLAHSPAVGDVIRFVYTGQHIVSDAGVSATAEIGAGEHGVVTITVVEPGTGGNAYTVEVVEGVGNNTPLSAALVGSDITVTLATDGVGALDPDANHAYQVAAAINALAGLSAVYSGNGAGHFTAAEGPTQFTGGTGAANDTTVREADNVPLAVLVAAHILMFGANKASQNTGSSGLPNDSVDRRSQSGEMSRRAGELLDRYRLLVGKGKREDLRASSGFKDLDVTAQNPRGFLWHPTGLR